MIEKIKKKIEKEKISINALAIKLDIPKSTLHRTLNGGTMSLKNHEKLKKYIK